MKLQALKNTVRFWRRESFVQGPDCVGREIIHHDADPLRVRIMDIGQIAHALGEAACGSPVRHVHMPPGFMRVEKHEQIGRAIAPIFVIIPLRLTWRGWDRLAYFTNQLCRILSKQTTGRRGRSRRIFARVERNDWVRSDRKSGAVIRRPADSIAREREPLLSRIMRNHSFPAALPSVTNEPKTVGGGG